MHIPTASVLEPIQWICTICSLVAVLFVLFSHVTLKKAYVTMLAEAEGDFGPMFDLWAPLHLINIKIH